MKILIFYLRVTQDRDSKHREVLHGFERQNNVEAIGNKFIKLKKKTFH